MVKKGDSSVGLKNLYTFLSYVFSYVCINVYPGYLRWMDASAHENLS